MTIYSIYRATNINNGKVYIGYTGKTLNERKAQHHIHHRKTKFSDALKQHNGANFVWEVIYQSRDGDHCLNVMESYFITEYNSYQNGYNSTSGGSGFSYDWDDARRSARAEHQRQLWLDDDYRTNHIEKQTAKWDEAAKIERSEMVRNIWVNEQYREKNCTRYIVTSPDKNTFEILGINQFCREHNLSHGAMIGVAKGERKQHKGWICKYKTI